MKLSNVALLLTISNVSAFAPLSSNTRTKNVVLNSLLGKEVDFVASLDKDLEYVAGGAQTEFAKKYSNLVGTSVRTVGEAMTEFTTTLGAPINALYKSAITDLVGTTHLITVDARFKRDALWSLGLISVTDLILKNYPERDTAAKIVSSLIECVGLDEDTIRAEAQQMMEWAEGKTKDDISAALRGEGDSPLAAIANDAKSDEFWMYSRYFTLGLVKIMDVVGLEPDMDSSATLLEEWMGTSLGKSFYSACSDSDLYFKTKSKLDIMETMMKEIEIREKKRMAERLEEKAEAAIRKAEREAEMAQVEKDDAERKSLVGAN